MTSTSRQWQGVVRLPCANHGNKNKALDACRLRGIDDITVADKVRALVGIHFYLPANQRL